MGGIRSVDPQGGENGVAHVGVQALAGGPFDGAAHDAAVQVGVFVIRARFIFGKIAVLILGDLFPRGGGAVLRAAQQGGGVAHGLAQGDGRIGKAGIADERALAAVGEGRVQVELAFLLEPHYAHGGDHLGQGGHFEHRIPVHGPSVIFGVRAEIVFVQDFPVPAHDHAPADGIRPGEKAQKIGVRRRCRFFVQFTQAPAGEGEQRHHQRQGNQPSYSFSSRSKH